MAIHSNLLPDTNLLLATRLSNRHRTATHRSKGHRPDSRHHRAHHLGTHHRKRHRRNKRALAPDVS